MNELADVTKQMPPPSGREPVMELVPKDIRALLKELQSYHAEFSPLFQRREQARWGWAEKCMQGQMLPPWPGPSAGAQIDPAYGHGCRRG